MFLEKKASKKSHLISEEKIFILCLSSVMYLIGFQKISQEPWTLFVNLNVINNCLG